MLGMTKNLQYLSTSLKFKIQRYVLEMNFRRLICCKQNLRQTQVSLVNEEYLMTKKVAQSGAVFAQSTSTRAKINHKRMLQREDRFRGNVGVVRGALRQTHSRRLRVSRPVDLLVN